MTQNGDFDAAFKDALEEVLGWDVELSEDDGPGTVEGWDSLMQIRLVHALETRFDVRLPDSALLEEQNVASLKTLVRNHADGAGGD
jgi:acyl carrier protein